MHQPRHHVYWTGMAHSPNHGDDGAFRILLHVPKRHASVVPSPIVSRLLSGKVAEPRPSKFCHLDRNARTLLVRPSGIDCAAAVANLITSQASSRGGVGMIGFVSFIAHNLAAIPIFINLIDSYVFMHTRHTFIYTHVCIDARYIYCLFCHHRSLRWNVFDN
jgi:hypothetical protein